MGVRRLRGWSLVHHPTDVDEIVGDHAEPECRLANVTRLDGHSGDASRPPPGRRQYYCPWRVAVQDEAVGKPSRAQPRGGADDAGRRPTPRPGGVLRVQSATASEEIKAAIGLAARNESGVGKTGLAVRLTEEDAAPVVAHGAAAGGRQRAHPARARRGGGRVHQS